MLIVFCSRIAAVFRNKLISRYVDISIQLGALERELMWIEIVEHLKGCHRRKLFSCDLSCLMCMCIEGFSVCWKLRFFADVPAEAISGSMRAGNATYRGTIEIQYIRQCMSGFGIPGNLRRGWLETGHCISLYFFSRASRNHWLRHYCQPLTHQFIWCQRCHVCVWKEIAAVVKLKQSPHELEAAAFWTGLFVGTDMCNRFSKIPKQMQFCST